jgi:hypothetical protein
MQQDATIKTAKEPHNQDCGRLPRHSTGLRKGKIELEIWRYVYLSALGLLCSGKEKYQNNSFSIIKDGILLLEGFRWETAGGKITADRHG